MAVSVNNLQHIMIKEKIKRKEFPFARINTRIRPDQAKYVKDALKKRNGKGEKIGDAGLHREIFDYYIKNHKI